MLSAGASLQLVPMIMELVAPIKSQRLYLIVGTSCKLSPAEEYLQASMWLAPAGEMVCKKLA